MAIAEISCLGLSLLPHAAGGAILAKGGSYVAGTYVSATVVEAFGTASAVLASVGSGATAAASSPIVIGGAFLGVVAVGGYCYFFGLPTAIAGALKNASLGASAKQGFMIPIPKLAVALVLLGGAGYVAYRFYQNKRDASFAAENQEISATSVSIEDRREVSGNAFGTFAWTQFGSALWAGVEDAAKRASKLAQEAVDAVGIASGSISATATGIAGSAYATSKRTGSKGAGLIRRASDRVWRLFRS